MAESQVRLAATEDDLRACAVVMRELRSGYTVEQLQAQMRRQMNHDRYRVALLEAATPMGRAVQAVAGFRIGECLAWGRFLYVDDLVTRESVRSAGYGGRLLDWLTEHARENGCGELHLDSGVQRFAAHRFYLKHWMNITSHHFTRKLNPLPAMPQARGGILGA